MKRIARKSFWEAVLCGIVVCVVSTLGVVNPVHAFPANHWEIGTGEHLEVLRSHACFDEGRAGERTTYTSVVFSRPVLSAEVFLSGFNASYTRQGNDHEVMQERVDAFVTR